jgi:hypothetical protein
MEYPYTDKISKYEAALYVYNILMEMGMGGSPDIIQSLQQHNGKYVLDLISNAKE